MQPAPSLSTRCQRLVVKRGVGLGGLPLDELALALAWVHAGLPAAVVQTEPQINTLLKAQLQGPAACLDTDHVELRRWLVDAGWLQRDAYGRAYQRVEALPPDQATLAAGLAELLAGASTADWAQAQGEAQRTERQARRQRWQAGQAQIQAGTAGLA